MTPEKKAEMSLRMKARHAELRAAKAAALEKPPVADDDAAFWGEPAPQVIPESRPMTEAESAEAFAPNHTPRYVVGFDPAFGPDHGVACLMDLTDPGAPKLLAQGTPEEVSAKIKELGISPNVLWDGPPSGRVTPEMLVQAHALSGTDAHQSFAAWLKTPAGIDATDPRLPTDFGRICTTLEDNARSAFLAGWKRGEG